MAAPVYVTIAGHIEDDQVYTNCEAYPVFRAKLLAFADLLADRGLVCNLQIDYEFLYGTCHCETEGMREETGGTNLIHYLATQYGFEIDAHQEGGVEEGPDNYADVRYLGGVLTTSISENVGGLVWGDPPQFARLASGETGLLYPGFEWLPGVLTLAVSHSHHGGDFSQDDAASGVWKPKGANTNFWVHDPDEHMVYVGPGEHINWGRDSSHLSTPEFVQYLVEGLQAETIPTDAMYTATLTVPQSVIFDTNEHDALTAMLDEIEPYVLATQAQYVTYSEVVDIWLAEFGGAPNIYYRPDLAPWYVARSGDKSFVMKWFGIGERIYAIEESTDLMAGAWMPAAGAESITGKHDSIILTNCFGNEPSASYRVKATD